MIKTNSVKKITTKKGTLSIEQLWDFTVAELNFLVESLEEEVETFGRKSFLNKNTENSKVIVLDILNTKIKEAENVSKER